MSVFVFQAASQIACCAIATWLYAHHLSEQAHFPARMAAILILGAAACGFAIASGYTLYPALTDNASFIAALAMFAVVIIALTVAVALLWKASPWTALFCASSGYLVQSIVYGLDRAAHVIGIVQVPYTGDLDIVDVLSYISCSAIVLSLFHHFITGRLQRSGLLGIRNPVMFFAVVLAMVVALVLDLSIKDILSYKIPFRYAVTLSIVYVAICAFIVIAEFEILYNQRLQTDMVTMERAMAEQRRQFELSSETIDAINGRVHDIRHHVIKLLADTEEEGAPSKETLRAIIHQINVYDAAVKTGNGPLDVVLTEKGLLCRRAGITFSCIADGHALDFMAAPDIYTLVGNALGNAIDAVSDIEGDDRRSIAFNLRTQMGMCSLSVENYFSGEVKLADGLPIGGGFGAEKMLAIVERYGGSIVCTADGDVFHVDILIPQD